MLVAGLPPLSIDSILDDHACAEASQRGQSPHPLLLDRRCASASERQTERRQLAAAWRNPPIAELGTDTHARSSRMRGIIDLNA